jgi:Zn ribbon nucleic-acid-binding protein
MIGHFAACPKCSSLDVMFVGVMVDGVQSASYHCYECGHDTPERDTYREADADVWWTPATVGTPDAAPAAIPVAAPAAATISAGARYA